MFSRPAAAAGLPLFHRAGFVTTPRATKDMRRFPVHRRGGRVVECTALEIRLAPFLLVMPVLHGAVFSEDLATAVHHISLGVVRCHRVG
jgi:hypothetical protein